MRLAIRAVLLLIVLFLAFVASRPDHYRVERSATFDAPPAQVYAQVADFHNWTAWSPWEHLDPAMKKDFSGPAAGVGASYHWVGNDKVGEGSMRITDATPDERIAIDLEFIKPFKSSNVTTFTFAPEGAGTKVSWVMEGKLDFMGKAMCLFMDMDKTVGGDFEKGLAALKGAAATAAPAAPADSTAPAPAAAQ